MLGSVPHNSHILADKATASLSLPMRKYYKGGFLQGLHGKQCAEAFVFAILIRQEEACLLVHRFLLSNTLTV